MIELFKPFPSFIHGKRLEFCHKIQVFSIQLFLILLNATAHTNNPRLARSIAPSELIRIKFEIDTNPPPFAGFEHKYRLLPSPYEICLYDQPSLFAGKTHAVLCRAWKNRIKGRDLYDYVFYLSMNTPVNLKHLEARLRQSGFLETEPPLDIVQLKNLLCTRFATIDYDQAKQDVLPFIKDPKKLAVWSQGFFDQITENLIGV